MCIRDRCKYLAHLLKSKIECRKMHDKVNYYDLLERFNLLTMSERVKYYSLWCTYKILKYGCTVKQITLMYTTLNNSSVNARITRNSQNCVVVEHKTSFFENSVQYYSVKLWNSLPVDIRNFQHAKIMLMYELQSMSGSLI